MICERFFLILPILTLCVLSCTKPESYDSVGNIQTQDPEPVPDSDPETPGDPKHFSIPDGFDECEFVAMVNSGSTCKSLILASGWKALVDSLQVTENQTIALVAMGKGTEYSVFPRVSGRPASTYYVTPSSNARMSAVWSCTATADSVNKAVFEPICRTYKLNINMTYRPADLDSVSFIFKQQTAISPVSPGIYANVKEVRYSIPASEFGHDGNYLPMTSPTAEMYQEVCFHYKDRYRNCLVHFDKKASARCDLKLILEMKEETNLSSPRLRLSGTYGDGSAVSKNCQLSMWDHPLSAETDFRKNTGFTIQSGVNMAFRYGSGVSWKNETSDKDKCEPSIWSDNDRYIRKYVSCGYDHFRIPMDEVAIVYSDCTPRRAVLDDIHKMADLAISLGARVILDLHWLKTSQSVPDAVNEAHFRATWKVLHEEFKDYPTDMLAYELMNEPGGPQKYWNFFIKNSIDMVRSWGGNEKERIIICACNHGQDVSGTDELELPSDIDPNLVMSYHDYLPTELTFYNPGPYPVAPVNYPGILLKDEDRADLTQEQIDRVENNFLYYYKSNLENVISRAARNGERIGVPVYVGEYGCDQWIDIKVRRRWFQDKCDLFRKYGMSFTSWFGLGVEYNDWYNVDSGIISATVVK